jgi:hypothetical protein
MCANKNNSKFACGDRANKAHSHLKKLHGYELEKISGDSEDPDDDSHVSKIL